ncbi:MAG TPA: Rv3654c family TadE-like protein [Actinomycetota bacterium]|jgi:secretion/DNA translocation related TadE-like protein
MDRRSTWLPRNPERGSVSVLAAAVMLMLIVMALATTDVARALSAASRAQAAADAAALAAAQDIVEPPSSGEMPAQTASRYADRNGARLVDCDCRPGGTEATVTVRVGIDGLLLLPSGREVTATARAVIDLSGAG